MTYSTGGNIEAADYNNYTGGPTANLSGQINSLYSTGKGNAGYGQGTIANVSSPTDTVTATQWTTLVNAVNTVRKHQSGASYSNLGTYSAGANINATNNFVTNLATAYGSRLTVAATTTVTGANFANVCTIPAQTAAATFRITRTATFANADAARYFWNAGGQLNLVFVSFTNTGGTQRGADIGNLAVLRVGTKAVKAVDCVARTGTGGTLNTDLTTGAGYYARTTANVVLVQVTSTQYTYTSDNIVVSAKTNGVQGSNSDNGTVFSFGVNLTSAARGSTFNQSINITLNNRVDVVYPAGGFLANTWGTVTIA